MHVSECSVHRYLKEIVNAGLIEIKKIGHNKNVYHFLNSGLSKNHNPKNNQEISIDTERPPANAKHDISQVQEQTYQNCNNVTIVKEPNSITTTSVVVDAHNKKQKNISLNSGLSEKQKSFVDSYLIWATGTGKLIIRNRTGLKQWIYKNYDKVDFTEYIDHLANIEKQKKARILDAKKAKEMKETSKNLTENRLPYEKVKTYFEMLKRITGNKNNS